MQFLHQSALWLVVTFWMTSDLAAKDVAEVETAKPQEGVWLNDELAQAAQVPRPDKVMIELKEGHFRYWAEYHNPRLRTWPIKPMKGDYTVAGDEVILKVENDDPDAAPVRWAFRTVDGKVTLWPLAEVKAHAEKKGFNALAILHLTERPPEEVWTRRNRPSQVEPENPDYQKYVAGLGPCDRVDVMRIGRPGGTDVLLPDGTYDFVLPADRSRLYHVEPHDQWWEIAAQATIRGADAERLAASYRALKPMTSTIYHEDGRVVSRGGAKCHGPPFAYRFYAGEKLLYDTSVCWTCENLIIGSDGQRHYFYFQTDSPESLGLFDQSNQLFPSHPAERPKFEKK